MTGLPKKALIRFLSCRALSSLATATLGRGLPVFLLHRLQSEAHDTQGLEPEHLRRCLQFLVDNDYRFVSLEDIVDCLHRQDTLPQRAVAFTMDDGYLDQAEVAAPIFLEFGCPVTFFVITDMLDGHWWPWDAKISWLIDNTEQTAISLPMYGDDCHFSLANPGERQAARQRIRDWLKTIDQGKIDDSIEALCRAAQLSLPEQPPRRYRAMNWEQAHELEVAGVRFAPHSKSHRIMSRLDDLSSRDEIVGSWNRLSERLDRPLKVFCYPTGRENDFGDRETDCLAGLDFRAAVTTVPGFIDTSDHASNGALRYRMPRFSMPDTLTDFIQYSTWIEYFKERLRGRA